MISEPFSPDVEPLPTDPTNQKFRPVKLKVLREKAWQLLLNILNPFQCHQCALAYLLWRGQFGDKFSVAHERLS